MFGQDPQERRPHAQAAMPGQDARADESRTGRLGPIGDAGAHHVAAFDRQQQQTVRRVLLTQLLDVEGARVGLDGETDSSPRFVIVVGETDRQLHGWQCSRRVTRRRQLAHA